MKQILIISGKGGTGKTFLTGCFAAVSTNKVMVDCDVDAANLHLLLHPEIKQTYDFISGYIAQIDKEKCTRCGECLKSCKFSAISLDFKVDHLSCEGCTVCYHVCPENAVLLKDRFCGQYFISETKFGSLVHAKLGIAQENSGKLVTKLKEIAKEMAEAEKAEYIIIDGPPGTGCPVMASMTGVDLVIAVTEATLSGLHDLKRVLELAKQFKVPIKVVINKYDLNPEMTLKIENQIKEIEIICTIPFSEEILNSVKAGIPFIEFSKSELARTIKTSIENII